MHGVGWGGCKGARVLAGMQPKIRGSAACQARANSRLHLPRLLRLPPLPSPTHPPNPRP
jgi:hypothetical protein